MPAVRALSFEIVHPCLVPWARVKAGTQIFFKKSALEASCRTKLVAPLKSKVNDLVVARLEALDHAVWKY
jgi:hypothetical protein